jgi:hypothetical protein
MSAMKVVTLLNVVGVLLASSETLTAEPVLLASYDFSSYGGHAPESDPRVEFILQLPAGSPPATSYGLGADLDIFWESGDQGLFNFTSSTDEAFDNLALSATDGIEDNFTIFDLFPSGGGGATPPHPESVLFGVSPDLVGNEVQLVRLIVHEISFDPWVPDPVQYPEIEGFTYTASLTYEFYGTPIPDPGTGTLAAAFLALFLVRRPARHLDASH